MIIGTGIDIVEIARLKGKDKDDAFLSRIYTDNELKYILKKIDNTPSLASHFAAKEAFLKALGTGIGYGFSTKDIEVAHDEKGKPFYVLSDNVYSSFLDKKNIKTHLSISHDKNYAVAFAIIESCN